MKKKKNDREGFACISRERVALPEMRHVCATVGRTRDNRVINNGNINININIDNS